LGILLKIGILFARVRVICSKLKQFVAAAYTHLIAGVDEVGRGPLAGSVVAAAVILNPKKNIDGLLDSKALDEARRVALDKLIQQRALAFCIAEASVEEIDQLNILHASMLAMQRAVAGLQLAPDLVLVDGNRCPEIAQPCQAIVKGDQHVQSISAASIIAKVARDTMMVDLHAIHPEFGFDRHKGYPTRQHREAIAEYGVLPIHRQSFAPVRQALAGKS
jgi:ribonuclease HII